MDDAVKRRTFPVPTSGHRFYLRWEGAAPGFLSDSAVGGGHSRLVRIRTLAGPPLPHEVVLDRCRAIALANTAYWSQIKSDSHPGAETTDEKMT
jgi:hypothetical protein